MLFRALLRREGEDTDRVLIVRSGRVKKQINVAAKAELVLYLISSNVLVEKEENCKMSLSQSNGDDLWSSDDEIAGDHKPGG